MDLSEFVKEAVVQVARAVHQVQGSVGTMAVNTKSDEPLMVNFDVVVAVNDDPNAAVGDKLKVMSAANSDPDNLAHRISFQIPIDLTVATAVNNKINDQHAKNQAALDRRIERFTSPFD